MQSTFRSLAEFQSELEAREADKQDYLVATQAMYAVDDETIGFGDNQFGVKPTAHQQLSAWSGIPKKYYDKMTEIPGLRAYNLDRWFQKSDDRRMIRTLRGDTRAFLSDRYRPIDNLQIMDASAPALNEVDGLRVNSVNITDDRMYVQFILPGLEGEITKGDVVQAGVCLTNSETGRGAVDIQMMIWRLVCTNGMIAGSILRKHHIGRQIGDQVEDYNLYQSDTLAAEMESYKLRIRDVMRDTLSEKRWQEILTNIKSGAEDPVHRPEPTVVNVSTRYGLNKDEQDKVMYNFIEFGNSNRWNLANAVTATAREVENPDRAYELEKVGWDIMNLDRKQWSDLSDAEDVDGELVFVE